MAYRKITFEKASIIRVLYNKDNIDTTELANSFGLTRDAIYKILDNETYHDPSYRRERFPQKPISKEEILAYIESLKAKGQ